MKYHNVICTIVFVFEFRFIILLDYYDISSLISHNKKSRCGLNFQIPLWLTFLKFCFIFISIGWRIKLLTKTKYVIYVQITKNAQYLSSCLMRLNDLP